MKLKHILKQALFAIIAIQLGSCSKDNDAEQKFDQTPTERIEARKKELQDLLLSSQYGWKVVYFTDDTQLGGFTHIIKFKDAKTVAMASDYESPDYAPDTSIHESEYAIQTGSTVSLVFTTKNQIHYLSDADYYPTADLRAQGYKGDFQFLYYGQEDGQIIFRTNRSFQELRFVKATAQDWTDLNGNIAMIDNVIGAPTRPLFRYLETNDGKSTQLFDFTYNSFSRFAATSPVEEGATKTYDFGIAYTPKGITISPAIELSGQKLTQFPYVSTSGNFTATGTANVSATIKYSNKPAVITDDYKLLLPSSGANNVYAHIFNLTKSAPTNSALFLDLLQNAETSAGPGIFINRIQPWFNNANGTNYIEYRFSRTSAPTVIIARAYHFFTLTSDATNKTVTLKPVAWRASSSPTAATIAEPSYLSALDRQLMNPNGLYFIKQLGLGYSAYTFTSTTTPFRMTVYSFQ